MNAYQLKKPDGTDSGVYVCGACGLVWRGQEQSAQECCTCRVCGKPFEAVGSFKPQCGTGQSHDECWRKEQIERTKSLIAKAEVVDWDSHVFNDLEGGGPDDGYADSMDALVEHLEGWLYDGDLALEDWPTHAFVCDVKPMRKLDLGDIFGILEG